MSAEDLHLRAGNTWAPRELLDLRQQISRGGAVLDRLLSDERMRRPWKEIGKRVYKSRVPTRVAYHRLWGQLITILQRSKRKERSRAAIRNAWASVSAKAAELSNTLRNDRLDLLAFRFYPDEVAQLVFSQKWRELDQWQQQELAYRVADVWPTLPELLDVLASQAKALSVSAMTEPRLVQRSTRDHQANYFVRGMAEYFRATFGGVMQGTLATITSVVLDKDISLGFVKNALRSEKV